MEIASTKRIPIAKLFLVLAMFVALNLDGFAKYVWSPWEGTRGSHWLDNGTTFMPITWAHGWPLCFMTRKGIDFSYAWNGPNPQGSLSNNSVEAMSNWPFGDVPTNFSYAALSVDIIVAFIFLAGIYFGFRNDSQGIVRFRLRTLFIFITVNGVVFALHPWQIWVYPQFPILHLIVLSIMIALAVSITVRLIRQKRSDDNIELADKEANRLAS